MADYRKLVEFFGGQFDKMHQEFGKIHQAIESKADKSDIDRILTRLAMMGNKLDDYRAEQLETKRQVDKHEKWHFEIANKVGVNLLSK